jgi:hypothetical protein
MLIYFLVVRKNKSKPFKRNALHKSEKIEALKLRDPLDKSPLPRQLSPALTTVRNKKALIAGMRKYRCFVSKAVAFAKVTRTTFYDYYRDDPEFRQAIEDLTEAKIDHMEGLLEDKAKISDVANIFWLKCKGRKRGWNERIIVDSNPDTVSFPESVIENAISSAFAAEKERLKNVDTE